MALPEGASFCAQCGSPVSVAQLGPVHVPQATLPPEEIPTEARVVLPRGPARYAGFWLRSVAFLIDTCILSFIFVLIASFYPSELIILPDRTPQPLLVIPQFKVQGILILFLIMWFYYAFFEASAWQATPGKKMLRLYVTDLAGRPITFWRASLRYCGRKISDLTLLVGYILAGFTEKKQALHDLLAGCLVLRRP